MPFGAQSWPLEPKSCGAVRKWGGCPPKKKANSMGGSSGSKLFMVNVNPGLINP